MATIWYTAHQAARYADEVRQRLSAGHPNANRVARVTERTIRSWVARRHLAPDGLGEDGRQLFSLGAVAQAETKTRRHALRMVGIT